MARKGNQEKKRGNKHKTNNKMVDLDANISVVTLNANSLSTQIVK